MKMIATISKPKLSKGLSYALKTSQLVESISDIECHLSLNYVTNLGAPVLRAWYWLPNDNVAYDRVYVTAGPVSGSERAAASMLMASEVIPAFIGWLHRTIDLPNESTKLASELIFCAWWFDDGTVSINCHPSG